jgi:transposase-like protein
LLSKPVELGGLAGQQCIQNMNLLLLSSQWGRVTQKKKIFRKKKIIMTVQIRCPKCRTPNKVIKYGKYRDKQRYRCTYVDDNGERCGYVFSSENKKGKMEHGWYFTVKHKKGEIDVYLNQIFAAKHYWIDHWKICDLARTYGTTRGCIYYWIKKFPKDTELFDTMEYTDTNTPTLSNRQERALSAAKLFYFDKWRKCDIARKYGVTPLCVTRWIKKYLLKE